MIELGYIVIFSFIFLSGYMLLEHYVRIQTQKYRVQLKEIEDELEACFRLDEGFVTPETQNRFEQISDKAKFMQSKYRFVVLNAYQSHCLVELSVQTKSMARILQRSLHYNWTKNTALTYAPEIKKMIYSYVEELYTTEGL
jgi:surface polysaccharide O-acyltransferase-like enzyme